MKRILLFLALLFGFFANVDFAPIQQPVSFEHSAQETSFATYAEQVAAHLPTISIGAPAHAAELNTDVGCDNSAAWMISSSGGGTVSVTGSKCVFSSVTSMKMLMQMTSKIKASHTYRLTFTISGYSAGTVRGFAGITMPTAPAGSWVTAASTPDIADNFTTSLGLVSDVSAKSTGGPGDSSENGGAFRFACLKSWRGFIDPLIYVGTNSPHLHLGWGNGSVGKNWTFNDFRTKGASTCGNIRDPKHPLNRTGYWQPDILDGLGRAVDPNMLQVYYKGPALAGLNYTGELSGQHPELYCQEASPTNDCRGIPTGLRFSFGYRKSTGTCGPLDNTSGCADYQFIVFDCWDFNGVQYGGEYKSMEAARVSGNCGLGRQLRIGMDMPPCWDGINIDSPDHRSHLSYPTTSTVHFGNSGCPRPHPVRIPGIGIMSFFTIDQAFVDGKWRLSSDEMVNGYVAGETYHSDYWEGWSPTIRQKWQQRCEDNHNSCSIGELGDGTRLKDGGGINYDGTTIAGNGYAKSRPDRYVPTRKFGMSKDYSGNGTYTMDITAGPTDGVWGLTGLGGFSGSLDAISIQELATGAKGPATVHN